MIFLVIKPFCSSVITDEQKGLITKKIINIAGTEKLELVTKTDPSLIGGFVASVGSKVIDASLASQIRKLGQVFLFVKQEKHQLLLILHWRRNHQ